MYAFGLGRTLRHLLVGSGSKSGQSNSESQFPSNNCLGAMKTTVWLTSFS